MLQAKHDSVPRKRTCRLRYLWLGWKDWRAERKQQPPGARCAAEGFNKLTKAAFMLTVLLAVLVLLAYAPGYVLAHYPAAYHVRPQAVVQLSFALMLGAVVAFSLWLAWTMVDRVTSALAFLAMLCERGYKIDQAYS